MGNTHLQQLDNDPTAIMRKFADHYDIPVTGVTNMGGKPYVNAAGLMAKAKKLGLKSVHVNVEKSATPADLSAIVKAVVELKDGSEFEDYGFGSKASIKMSTLHNPDFITMTTITRAKNRALRSATGFGLVSAEEVAQADTMYSADDTNLSAITDSNLDSIEAPKIELKDVKVEKKEVTHEDLHEMDKVKDRTPEQKKIVEDSVRKTAEEIFGIDDRRDKVIEFELLVESKKYDTKKMFDSFMVSNASELSNSQLDICMQAVNKGKQF